MATLALSDSIVGFGFKRAAEAGERWYKTGDIVVEAEDGNHTYAGRKDRTLAKERGYRAELGEIESCLYRHPDVREAAVVAVPDELGLTVRARPGTRDGGRLSLIKLKVLWAEHLPSYMIPDVFAFHAELPKTSTEKTDYQALMKTE